MNQWPADVKPTIRINGYFPGKITQKLNRDSKKGDFINLAFKNLNSKYQKHKVFEPMNVVAEGASLAIKDTKQRLWLITDASEQPICISDLLQSKTSLVALAHNQMVVCARKKYYLLSWEGRKAFSSNHLQSIDLANCKSKLSSDFQLHQITDIDVKTNFFFNPNNNVSEQSWLFAMPEDRSVLVSYPCKKTLKTPTSVKGLSVGKHISLYWDYQGNIYSWGCRSIALGYGGLPNSEYVSMPKTIQTLKDVAQAYAGKNYCLAITFEGKLYEWGIKRVSQSKQQLIFVPRQISLESPEKFVDLKGKDDKYAVLTLSGKLFIWGKGAQQHISNRYVFSQTEDYQYEPRQISQQYGFIHDFSMSQSYLVLITANKQCTGFSYSRKTYWNHFKQNVKDCLIWNEGIKTQQSESRPKKIGLVDFRSPQKCNTKIKDPVQQAYSKIQSKEKYFQAASQGQNIFKYILQTTKINQFDEFEKSTEQTFSVFNTNKNVSLKKSSFKLSKTMTAVDQLSKEFKKEKQHVKKLLFGLKKSSSKSIKKQMIVVRKSAKVSDTLSYNNRLEAVMKKKQNSTQQWLEDTVRKIQTRDLQSRNALKRLADATKKEDKINYIIARGLQQLLIKQILVKIMTSPLAQGRQILIQNFSKHLKISRVERQIRGLFMKTKIKLRLQNMYSNSLSRFFLLVVYFQRYVKRYRQKKYKLNCETVVKKVYTTVILNKMKIGLATCKFNIKKLQKFREWVSMYKKQQKKCLKSVWKIQLLATLKVNSQHQNIVFSHVPRCSEDVNVQQIFAQRLILNPDLKLPYFLNKHMVFRIKVRDFHKIQIKFFEQSKKINNNQNAQYICQYRLLRRTRLTKFMRQQSEQKLNRFNFGVSDILPFSLHHDIFMHPKNFDVFIPEIMKKSERWVKQEHNIFERQLESILLKHERQFRQKRKQYDFKLATYIRKNYDRLSEKRWRYILEYNKLQKTPLKAKQQKQLLRLLRLIGAEQLIETDFIPQKHTVLQLAKQQLDAPRPPVSCIQFGMAQFKSQYKKYCESVFFKMKELRKSYF